MEAVAPPTTILAPPSKSVCDVQSCLFTQYLFWAIGGPESADSASSLNSRPALSRANSVPAAIRVRPALKPGDPGFDLIPQRFRGSTCHVTTANSLAVDASAGRKTFVFDRVFSEDVDQEGIFEYVADSVNSFVQGYNVSILAYGQSGAGKSYTMGTTGPGDQGDERVMGMEHQHEYVGSALLTCGRHYPARSSCAL